MNENFDESRYESLDKFFKTFNKYKEIEKIRPLTEEELREISNLTADTLTPEELEMFFKECDKLRNLNN